MLLQTIKVFEVLKEKRSNERFGPPTRSALQKINSQTVCIGESVLRFDSKCCSNLFGKAKIELSSNYYKEKLLAFKVLNKNQRAYLIKFFRSSF